MPLIEIDSLDDPRLEVYRELKRAHRARWTDEFIVEGDWLVERLVASRYPVRSLLMAQHRLETRRSRLAALRPETPVYVLPADLVSELVGFPFHRGLLGCGGRLPEPPLEALLDASPAPSTLIVCPETRDPENLGSVIRSSAALGARGALLGPTCIDPLARRALRVSMGAALRLPTRRATSLVDDLAMVRAAGYEITAAVVDACAEPLSRFEPSPRTALLVGNEANGLSPEFLALCSRRVSIPMAEGVDSLNVAVATGILLYRFLAER